MSIARVERAWKQFSVSIVTYIAHILTYTPALDAFYSLRHRLKNRISHVHFTKHFFIAAKLDLVFHNNGILAYF